MQKGFDNNGVEFDGDLKQFFNEIDENGDGKLSMEEIINSLNKLQKWNRYFIQIKYWFLKG